MRWWASVKGSDGGGGGAESGWKERREERQDGRGDCSLL